MMLWQAPPSLTFSRIPLAEQRALRAFCNAYVGLTIVEDRGCNLFTNFSGDDLCIVGAGVRKDASEFFSAVPGEKVMISNTSLDDITEFFENKISK
jgi:hypothetical protein